ncbi:vacuolar sorting-associated protein [Raphidocelis subcapitata]|uniref:Vacuolar sorting-associated protein n=1 Tax=Raphidocelis subcapitata TaxID=307507 RepID=A0A2V0P131_9CHLO|nr:vacuolar sorting-associated protein [Raphidocelis subcapitata]|eukprot:GBF93578.1 vacuolar sorting-associated protein [Raphidocelis subcapitata]
MFKGVTDLFKKPDPKELVRKWQSSLRAEQRNIERQIRDIQFEEKKVRKSITEAAKRNDMATCRILAKEIIQSRRAVSRLYVNKAQMISIGNALSEQLAMVKVAGTLQRSSDVMKLINESMKLPEMQRTMMDMAREMQKAGLIEEMTSEALDSALGGEDIEEEADEEVDAVLREVAGEVLAALPAAKARPAAVPQQQQQEEAPEEREELAALQERLNAARPSALSPVPVPAAAMGKSKKAAPEEAPAAPPAGKAPAAAKPEAAPKGKGAKPKK